MSMGKSRVQETVHRSRIYQRSDGYRLRWSEAHTRGEMRGIQREFGSERADTLRRIGLVVAQTSSTRFPVCAESWEPHSSFPRDSRRAESLVPPE